MTPTSPAARFRTDLHHSRGELLLVELFDEHHWNSEPFVETLQLAPSLDASALLPTDAEVQRVVTDGDVTTTLARTASSSFLIRCSPNATRVTICAPTPEALSARVADVRRSAPAVPSDRVQISMWRNSLGGGLRDERDLSCPTWDDVTANYPRAVRSRLEPIMRYSTEPSVPGRLLLWHGEAGTGKTSAVRALLRSWQPWCDAHYVLDPEVVLNDMNYFAGLVAAPTGPRRARTGTPGASTAKLIVAEDCDQLLLARPSAGAGLSRLLNLTDGILGQGTHTYVLLTTNEPVSRLNPALTRPGRCLDVTEFTRFDGSEATAWLGRPSASATLANLYAARDGHAHTADTVERNGTYL